MYFLHIYTKRLQINIMSMFKHPEHVLCFEHVLRCASARKRSARTGSSPLAHVLGSRTCSGCFDPNVVFESLKLYIVPSYVQLLSMTVNKFIYIYIFILFFVCIYIYILIYWTQGPHGLREPMPPPWPARLWLLAILDLQRRKGTI